MEDGPFGIDKTPPVIAPENYTRNGWRRYRPTLQTGGEDAKTTLETSGKNPLKSDSTDLFLFSSPKLTPRKRIQNHKMQNL